MKEQINQRIKNAFDSLLRADYLDIENNQDLKKLNSSFIDFFNATGSILQKQDSFISGRRGSGKTASLMNGYYECLKTIHPKIDTSSTYFSNEKILPIYIDLSKSSDFFDRDNSQLFEIHFIRQLIDSLKRQIEAIFDKPFLLLFKKENPALDDLDYIEKLLTKGVLLSVSKTIDTKTKNVQKENDNLNASIGLEKIELGASSSLELSDENIQAYSETKGFNTQEFLNKLADIRVKAGIDYIYLFLDEFSDLNPKSQLKFSTLLKSFLGSKSNLFIKLGVITDRYDFGDKIIIGRDIFPIPLDINEHVERLGGLAQTLSKFEETIELLIQKRFNSYSVNMSFNDITKGNRNEIIKRIARESIGIPRTIGLILQHSWKQAESKDYKIGLSELTYGIRSTRRIYQRQFEGAIKRKLIPGFYNDLWNKIIKRAVSEKTKHPDRPASHILISPERKDYLKIFNENFILHLLEEGRSSKYGGNYNLYALDFDICNDLNIKYAENKDEFTAIRFIYDDVLAEFDAYFVKDKLKSYKCPKCEKIYEESDVAMLKVKRCFEDDTVLDEIIHKSFEISKENLAEVEIKILGLISTCKESDCLSASEIANYVGCNWQKVSGWCSRVLAPKDEVFIVRKNNKNYYYGE